MHATLSPTERRQLAELQPAMEQLHKDVQAAKKARTQVGDLRRLLTGLAW